MYRIQYEWINQDGIFASVISFGKVISRGGEVFDFWPFAGEEEVSVSVLGRHRRFSP